MRRLLHEMNPSMKFLAVTVPQRFYHHRFSGNGAHSYALPSRFLDPAANRFVPSATGVPAESAVDQWIGGGRDTVGDSLEELWG